MENSALLQEYKEELARWEALMLDQPKNALTLNTIGENLFLLQQELIAQGIIFDPIPEVSTR